MAGGKIKKAKPSKSGSAISDPHFRSGNPYHKSKRQHILKNPRIIDSIFQKSGIKPSDIILEIAPGRGDLTYKLLKAGSSVIAVELDRSTALELQRRFQGTPYSNRLQVIQVDVMQCDLPYFDICVANIPYKISSPLVSKLLSHRPLFRCAVIIFQSDFAMRLVAQPGDTLYCRLSVNTQLLARVSHLSKVGRSNFKPPLKVDSSVVKIEPREPIPPVNFEEWDGLTRICFNRKNKTLHSVFRQKAVISLLEKNYKTLGALLEVPPEGSADDDAKEALCASTLGVDEGDDDKDESDSDDAGTDASGFKDKVLGVLKLGDFEEKRSSKLTQADFIQLLTSFNEAGIHFC